MSAEERPAPLILDFDIEELVFLISAGKGPSGVDTSYLVQIGIWSELRAIRRALEGLRSLTAVEIVNLLRNQFRKPGHSLEVGRPEDGDSMTAVYEVYPDGDRTLFARFDSSSDAEAVVTAINEACKR